MDADGSISRALFSTFGELSVTSGDGIEKVQLISNTLVYLAVLVLN